MLKKAKRFFSYIRAFAPKRKPTVVGVAILVSVVLFVCVFWAYPTFAQSVDDIVRALERWLAEVMLTLGELCIRLMVFFLAFFIELARFNDYIDLPIVMLGWTMVRDVANMFFVVVLLIIAIGTILGIEQYQWNKMLVKLILAAVFINFSNLICGLFIDVAHVFTITFLNAIASTAGGNLINMFHLNDMFTMVNGQAPSSDTQVKENMDIRLLAAAVTAFLFAGLSLITLVVYCVIMLWRVIMLWLLVILSPIAYITSTIPQGQSYAKEWWDEFSKYVLAAPLMVFFLWLAFATMGEGSVASQMGFQNLSKSMAQQQGSDMTLGGENAVALSKITEWLNLANLLIPIAFLWAGLERVQKLGVRGGGMVSSGMDFFKKAATIATGYAAGRWLARGGLDVGKKAGKFALMNVPFVGGKAWVRRGAFIHDKALGVADWWNQGLGAWTNLQFGAHDKIMKNRKAAIEQRQARISSSAKGWLKGGGKGFGGNLATKFGRKIEDNTPFGRAVGGVEKFRKSVRKMEGEGGVRKERSEMKKSYEMAEGAKEYLVTEEGESTEESKEMARRRFKKETAQAEINTMHVQAQLDVLNATGGKDKEVAEQNIRARVKDLDMQNAFSGRRKEMEGEHEQKKIQEATDEEGRILENVKAEHKPEVERVVDFERQLADVQDADKREVVARKLEEAAQIGRGQAQEKATRHAEMGEKLQQLAKDGKKDTDEYKNLEKEKQNLSNEIDDHNKKADDLEKQAREARGLGGAGSKEEESWQERMLALLAQINQGVREPLKGGPDGLFAKEANKEEEEAGKKQKELDEMLARKEELEKSGEKGGKEYKEIEDGANKLKNEITKHNDKAKTLRGRSKELDKSPAQLMEEAEKQRGEAEKGKARLQEIAEKKSELEKQNKTNSEEYRDISSEEAGLQKSVPEAEAKAKELEEEALAKQMEESAKPGGADLNEKMIELLEQIVGGVKDVGKKTGALNKIKADDSLRSLFGQMFAGKQLNEKFMDQDSKNLEKMLDYMKDQKKAGDARKFVEDGGNKKQYTADFESLLQAKENALRSFATSNKNSAFSAAYYKVKSDEVAGSKGMAHDALTEELFQKAIADRRHVRSPADSYDTEIARLQKSIGKKEKEGLMASVKALASSMVYRREQGGAEYDQSQAGQRDHMWLLALTNELRRQRYLDDNTGMPEKLTIEQKIENIAQDAGLDSRKFLNDSNRLAQQYEGVGGGKTGGAASVGVLERIDQSRDSRKYLQEIHQNLDVNIQQKLAGGIKLSDEDKRQMNLALTSYLNNKNTGLNKEELMSALDSLHDDNSLRRLFQEMLNKQ